MKKNMFIPFMACLFVPQYIWAVKKDETGIIEVNDAHMPRSIYDAKCGICKKYGATFLWFSQHDSFAHRDCDNSLKELEKSFWDAAEIRYPTHGACGVTVGKQRDAHIATIAVIEAMIAGRAGSIKEFIEKYGSDEIKVIFDQAAATLLVDAKK